MTLGISRQAQRGSLTLEVDLLGGENAYGGQKVAQARRKLVDVCSVGLALRCAIRSGEQFFLLVILVLRHCSSCLQMIVVAPRGSCSLQQRSLLVLKPPLRNQSYSRPGRKKEEKKKKKKPFGGVKIDQRTLELRGGDYQRIRGQAGRGLMSLKRVDVK